MGNGVTAVSALLVEVGVPAGMAPAPPQASRAVPASTAERQSSRDGPTRHTSALTRRIVSSMTPVARSAFSRGSLVNFFSKSSPVKPYDV
jgi:hypothetical protein